VVAAAVVGFEPVELDSVTSLATSKKQSSIVKSCSNDNMIQYVTFGSSPNQAIQNAQHQQELKIKSGVSKNFASQVMSKFGIKPGMSEVCVPIMRNIFNSSFRVCHRSSCHSFWNTLFTILLFLFS
jgi:hypothetical protein